MGDQPGRPCRAATARIGALEEAFRRNATISRTQTFDDMSRPPHLVGTTGHTMPNAIEVVCQSSRLLRYRSGSVAAAASPSVLAAVAKVEEEEDDDEAAEALEW